MTALPLNPQDNNYLSCRLINQQLTDNQLDVILADDVSEELTPKVVLDGAGRASLQGSVSIDAASPAANYKLLDLPLKLIPKQDYNFPVCVLRSGAYVTNAVKLESEGSGIEGITVTTAGSYETLPTFTVEGNGTGADIDPIMKTVGAGVDTIQSGAGSYVPADTIEIAGGTNSIAAVFTVTHTQVASATVAAAGTGGTPGTATVTGTTGTGTKFEASVTISGGGAISSVNSITTGGDYTVNPTSLTAEPVTGGGLTGAQLNVKMGVLSVTPSIVGSYTALPSSPVAQAATSGAGTGATFNVVWGILGGTVVNAGAGYDSDSTLEITGGGGSGGGGATLDLSAETAGTLTLINAPTQNDVVSLDGINFLVEPYY